MQAIAPAPSHQDVNADNDLRAQLAAVINSPRHHTPHHAPQHAPSSSQQQQHLHHSHVHGYGDAVTTASSTSSHGQGPTIDPAIAGHHPHDSDMMDGESGGDDNSDGRKGGKRELSQSKRAAQNRAAQRAFRQRKEGYIKKLEEQVREFHALEDNYKALQTENYSLREYIIHLQSRLIESRGEYPQPPPNINLALPRPAGMSQAPAPVAGMGAGHGPDGVGLTAMAARAVEGMGIGDRGEKKPETYNGKRRDGQGSGSDEAEALALARQLQGGPERLSTPVSAS